MKGDQKKEDKEVLKRRKILEEPFKKVALEFLMTAIVVVVLLYLGLLAISRTDGFRSLIAERLSEEIGGPFEVGKSHFDWRLNLHAGEIRSTGDPREFGRVDVVSLSAYWSMAGLVSDEQPFVRSVEVNGVSILAIHTGAERGWQPRVFQFLENVNSFASEQPEPESDPVSAVAGAAPPGVKAAAVTAEPAEKTEEASSPVRSLISVKDSQLNIIGRGGARLANFGNLQFNYVPTFNEGLEVQLYQLTGEYVLQNTRIPRQQIDVEVLHAGDEVVVRRLRAGAQMLMSLSKAFGKSGPVDEEAMAVLPPPKIPSLEPEVPTPQPPLTSLPEPKPKTLVAKPEDLPPIYVPPVEAVAITNPPVLTPKVVVTPKPPEPSVVENPIPSPVIPLRENAAAAVDEVVSAVAAVVKDAEQKAPEREAVTAANKPEVVLPRPEPGRPEEPNLVDANPGKTAEPAPPLDVVKSIKPVPARPLTPPRITSETVVERVSSAAPDISPASKSVEPAKPDEAVVSEIERVLQDALNVQRNARKDREAALRKFADITNDFNSISNEIERVIEDVEADPSVPAE